MHGTIMLLLYATPVVFGFANCVLPLQIGAPDVAFPRLNALSLLAVSVRRADHRRRFCHPGWGGGLRLDRLCAAQGALNSPGVGADLWIMGLAVSGLGTILGAVNMITTVLCMRGPG